MKKIFLLILLILIWFLGGEILKSYKAPSENLLLETETAKQSAGEAKKMIINTSTECSENIFAVHIVLKKVSLEDAILLVNKAKTYGFNTIQILITDGVALDHAPWKVLPDAWSKFEFKEFVQHVNEQNMQLIPELKLFTHQEKFFQKWYPDLMYNKVTYNPDAEGLYEYVIKVIDEVVDMVNPAIFHIGHDEVAGHKKASKEKWLAKGEDIAPAELFLKDVLHLHKIFEDKNIQLAMWGDMLISQKEFPGMLPRHLHGNSTGYGQTLREKIPKDIIIMDWHYSDKQKEFNSTKKMVQEGFTVLGATWKGKVTIDNFTKSGFENGAAGMISTTWWHVQKKDWDIVDTIFKNSSDAYKQHFCKESLE